MPPTTIVQAGTDNGLVSLAEIGGRWNPVPGGLTGKAVVAIAFSAATPTVIYAAVRGYGLFHSSDSGRTWRQVLVAKAHSLLQDSTNPQRLWVGGEPPAIWHSRDGGQSWTNLQTALLAMPEAEDWTDPEPSYRTQVHLLAQLPGQPEALLAGILAGTLLRSPNGGQTWQLSDIGLIEPPLGLAGPPNDGRVWLAATADGVYRSTDAGQRWVDFSEGMDTLYTTTVLLMRNGSGLAAATGAPPGNWVENVTSTLYRLAPAGSTWQPVEADLSEYITTLAGDPLLPQAAYLGTQSGVVYRSTDGGRHWEAIVDLGGRINTLVVARVG